MSTVSTNSESQQQVILARGAVRTPGLGFRYADHAAEPTAGAPTLGKDTRAILAELGLQAEEIETLAASRVIG